MLLLGGKPIYQHAVLTSNLEVEAAIQLDGRSWIVADVRERPGDVPLLVCIIDA